ncbi:hypothetical protein ACOR62_00240 [Neisseria lisongii]|uniref:Lipoprotein n=1 Tax=Neisseria lisongii TaxID=2912188 RepID=A0AAW5AMR8_9NEIS|nr:hypothetical protein [Neisseria lisongii]MCF7530524.1 hypothetical protein [Neisseria lisongii]
MKTWLLPTAAVLGLAACASGVKADKPLPQGQDIRHVCIKQQATRLEYKDREVVEWFRESLTKRNISSEIFNGSKDNCRYLLTYSIKGKRQLIVRGRLRLIDFSGSERAVLGEASYKYRGEEKAIARNNGIQDQIDRMVGELFAAK